MNGNQEGLTIGVIMARQYPLEAWGGEPLGLTRSDIFFPVASSYRFGAVPIHLAALLFLCLPDAPSDTVSGW